MVPSVIERSTKESSDLGKWLQPMLRWEIKRKEIN